MFRNQQPTIHEKHPHHRCRLGKQHPPGLKPLPPNATLRQKFCQQLRSLCIPDNAIKSRAFFRSNSDIKQELKRCKKEQAWYIIHPLSTLSEIMNWMMFFVWTCWLYVYPLFSISYVNLHISLHIILKALQIITITSFFFTGYITPKNEIVIEPKRIVYHYLSTYFIFDLSSVVVLTIYEIVATSLWSKQTYLQNFRWYLYVFCYAMFSLGIRIRTILIILERALSERNINKSVVFVIMNSFKILYVLHAVSCLFYLIPMALNAGKFPKDSWFVQLKIHNPKTPYDYVEIYTKCLTVCVCTFFGAKHSNYKPTEPNERLTIALVSFFGRVYTLFFIASLLKVFGIVGVSESKYDQCIIQLTEYMNSKKLPPKLRNRLIEFYENKLKRRYFNEREILDNLSDVLRTELFLYGAKSLIEKTPLLKRLSNDVLGALFTQMISETYLGGDLIVKPGDEITYIRFIASGTVVVYSKYGLELAHLKDGGDFGFRSKWVSKKSFHEYAYIAIETTQIYYIPVKIFSDFFRGKSDILMFFETKTKTRHQYFRNRERDGSRAVLGENVLTSLSSGLLLEPRVRKTFAFE